MTSHDARETVMAATGEACLDAEPPMEEVSAELLIEEVSIDGMCGVY